MGQGQTINCLYQKMVGNWVAGERRCNSNVKYLFFLKFRVFLLIDGKSVYNIRIVDGVIRCPIIFWG